MQLATGSHLPIWTWHSSMSIIYPKWDSVRETVPNGAKGESTYGDNGCLLIRN